MLSLAPSPKTGRPYHSNQLFRGWAFKVTPEGKSIPIASGLRSPGGIGFNEHGALFYMESQGPWNSACSLKFIKEGGETASYQVTTFTYNYAQGYGGPEVDQTAPNVKSVKISEDGLTATIALDVMTKGHVHEFDLRNLLSRDGEELLHRHAYYTLNEVPDK